MNFTIHGPAVFLFRSIVFYIRALSKGSCGKSFGRHWSVGIDTACCPHCHCAKWSCVSRVNRRATPLELAEIGRRNGVLGNHSREARDHVNLTDHALCAEVACARASSESSPTRRAPVFRACGAARPNTHAQLTSPTASLVAVLPSPRFRTFQPKLFAYLSTTECQPSAFSRRCG